MRQSKVCRHSQSRRRHNSCTPAQTAARRPRSGFYSWRSEIRDQRSDSFIFYFRGWSPRERSRSCSSGSWRYGRAPWCVSHHPPSEFRVASGVIYRVARLCPRAQQITQTIVCMRPHVPPYVCFPILFWLFVRLHLPERPELRGKRLRHERLAVAINGATLQQHRRAKAGRGWTASRNSSFTRSAWRHFFFLSCSP